MFLDLEHIHVYSLYDATPSLENAVSYRFLVYIAVGRGTEIIDGIKTGAETRSIRRETSPSSTLSTINPTLTLLGENNISCHKARNIVTKKKKKDLHELH